MDAISKVQQNMLSQMEQLKGMSANAPVQPPRLFAEEPGSVGFSAAFNSVVRSVDAQQHQSSKLMADVDSGKSDNLMGAMIESQKASVSFSALLQVRNKLTTAFDDIMRMPL
ncbi:flagellar hook-basal body complex protein FliE [Pseudomonas sp. TTU2014-080ASC]|jgi:flagellar hook-basal body complex protein FliE|uniref:flagellar hook-basal body complex protein FliE n=1 Tax=Pseudomonas sp. TTU2014-080ASC TaxID=1729724 RepID=UPI0007184A14|nr:flagellar hook-basal body complex protein FliE [Pseudomonas sp. TTU2014-080ASC]KRW61176.1 flagellar hook-basal body protein FliE [Pseudomonas sp. TTU2014-080ASC]